MLTTAQSDHFATFGFAACQASIPGYVAAITPGDVIAFDLHTWHTSFGGRDRLAWTAVYQRCPETAAHPRRAPVIERRRQAGVLDLAGGRDGW